MQSHIGQESNPKPIFKANFTTTGRKWSWLGCTITKSGGGWTGLPEIGGGILVSNSKIGVMALKSAKSRYIVDILVIKI